jgi:hypothetical protein
MNGKEAQRPTLDNAHHAQRWARVCGWKGLRGEPKVAWWFLYHELAGGQCQTIDVHPGAVAAHQNTEHRSGVRALESLARQGLIEIIDQHSMPWKVFLADPLVVAIARRAHAGDGQAELFATAGSDDSEEPQYATEGLPPGDADIHSLNQLVEQRQSEARLSLAPAGSRSGGVGPQPPPNKAGVGGQHPPPQRGVWGPTPPGPPPPPQNKNKKKKKKK